LIVRLGCHWQPMSRVSSSKDRDQSFHDIQYAIAPLRVIFRSLSVPLPSCSLTILSS
jgi:hypothetical protein